jgi:hypothetical protein
MHVTPVTQKQLAPRSTRDLRPSERRFLAAMQQLVHGRFESLPIRQGELVLAPWPTTIRSVKFGNATPKLTGRPKTGEHASAARAADEQAIRHRAVACAE